MLPPPPPPHSRPRGRLLPACASQPMSAGGHALRPPALTETQWEAGVCDVTPHFIPPTLSPVGVVVWGWGGATTRTSGRLPAFSSLCAPEGSLVAHRHTSSK